MKIAHINENGISQIAAALRKYHRNKIFTQSQLNAWASNAEDNFLNGNACYFEIRSTESVIGIPVEVVISETGYDIEDIEE